MSKPNLNEKPVQGTELSKNNDVQGVTVAKQNEEASRMIAKTDNVSNEAISAILSDDSFFEGEGTSTLSEYLRKEIWIGELKDKEVKIVFQGAMSTSKTEENGDEAQAVLFYADLGKGTVLYKCAATNLVKGLVDGGKGLYKVKCKGEKKRDGKQGTFIDFEVKRYQKIN
jgi:hypothetical protein